MIDACANTVTGDVFWDSVPIVCDHKPHAAHMPGRMHHSKTTNLYNGELFGTMVTASLLGGDQLRSCIHFLLTLLDL